MLVGVAVAVTDKPGTVAVADRGPHVEASALDDTPTHRPARVVTVTRPATATLSARLARQDDHHLALRSMWVLLAVHRVAEAGKGGPTGEDDADDASRGDRDGTPQACQA